MIIWKRKLYRIGFGSIVPTVYIVQGRPYLALGIAAFFLSMLLALEYERHKNPNVWGWFLSHFGGIFKTMPGTLTGETNFMIAAFLSVLYLPGPIAISNLYFLVFGDAFSAFVGKNFGKVPVLPGKTLEGMLAGIAANIIVALLLNLHFSISFEILLVGVLLGSAIEVLPLKIDDNLTVGLIPGIVMGILYSK
jgi:dolichol kinase